jgi:hypothetical protein
MNRLGHYSRDQEETASIRYSGEVMDRNWSAALYWSDEIYQQMFYMYLQEDDDELKRGLVKTMENLVTECEKYKAVVLGMIPDEDIPGFFDMN